MWQGGRGGRDWVDISWWLFWDRGRGGAQDPVLRGQCAGGEGKTHIVNPVLSDPPKIVTVTGTWVLVCPRSGEGFQEEVALSEDFGVPAWVWVCVFQTVEQVRAC